MQDLLIIGFVWPEPESSAAGRRMLQLIDLFQKQRWRITFASTAAYSAFAFDVTSIGIEKISIELNHSSFDTFVKELNPAMVLFDRFMTEEQFGWRVADQCPNALRVLDTEDLHCLRAARQLAVSQNRALEMTDLFSDLAKREIASIFRCDLALIISTFEMDLLRDFFKVDPRLLHYLPFLVDPIDSKDWPAFDDREDFVFVGNFLHEPNRHAVQYLKAEIWPKVRTLLPDAKLRIYGAYPTQKVLQWHRPSDGFYIMGRADNASEVVKKARVVLAPIRFGAGAKGKLLEAMQCGTPSVTTTIGAESMAGELPWNGLIADDFDVFAQAAAQLYTDEPMWKQFQQNGIAIVAARYVKSLYADGFMATLSDLRNGLQQHRLGNFVGAMLQHHAMASTQFMSRWIQEKNRVR